MYALLHDSQLEDIFSEMKAIVGFIDLFDRKDGLRSESYYFQLNCCTVLFLGFSFSTFWTFTSFQFLLSK